MSIFGNLFDFNRDGKLDALEQGAELGFIMQMMDAQKQNDLTSYEIDHCDELLI